MDVLLVLFVDDFQSEPHEPFQNSSERRNQTIKRNTRTLLNRNKAPSFCWSLQMGYIFLLNHTNDHDVKTITLKASTGYACNINPLMHFSF